MMNHYLREIINCMNYNIVLSQVFFFLLLGFHAHVREVSKVSHLYFYPGFSFIFMAINLSFFVCFRDSTWKLWYIWRIFWIILWNTLMLCPSVEEYVICYFDN